MRKIQNYPENKVSNNNNGLSDGEEIDEWPHADRANLLNKINSRSLILLFDCCFANGFIEDRSNDFTVNSRKKKDYLVSLLFCLILILLPICLTFPLPWDTSETLIFRICTNKTEYLIGENIYIIVELQNNWYKPIEIKIPSLSGHTLVFEILTPDGYIVKYMGPYVSMPPPYMLLKPKEKYIKEINLVDPLYIWTINDSNIPYKFSTEGTYFIRAIYMPDNTHKIFSNVISFDLTTSNSSFRNIEVSCDPTDPDTDGDNINDYDEFRGIYKWVIYDDEYRVVDYGTYIPGKNLLT